MSRRRVTARVNPQVDQDHLLKAPSHALSTLELTLDILPSLSHYFSISPQTARLPLKAQAIRSLMIVMRSLYPGPEDPVTETMEASCGKYIRLSAPMLPIYSKSLATPLIAASRLFKMTFSTSMGALYSPTWILPYWRQCIRFLQPHRYATPG